MLLVVRGLRVRTVDLIPGAVGAVPLLDLGSGTPRVTVVVPVKDFFFRFLKFEKVA